MIVGIGIDIVETPRIAGLIERHGERFIARTYTEREIAYCHGRARSVEHYAARWAAKEAASKAFGTGIADGIHWKDIEVLNEVSGQPRLLFHGTAQKLASTRGVTSAHLTITHTEGYSAAVVVLEAC
jgi:holo-[acyl-carrier protein] synthase